MKPCIRSSRLSDTPGVPPCDQPVRYNHGFTLVELLVVIAIIGVLVALLLPAVQAAREAARRSQCLNNLKQIGLAFHNYHSARGHFAPGWTEDNRDIAADRGPNLAWGYHILPYMEQAPLYEQFDPTLPASFGTQGGQVQNIDLIGLPVEAYRCPSSDSPLTHYVAGQGNFYPEIPEYAISNYVGSGSSCEVCQTGYLPDKRNGAERAENCFETNPNSPLPFPIPVQRTDHNGVIYRNSNLPLKRIIDGSSNTFLIGERFHGEFVEQATGRTLFTQAYWAGIPGPSSNQLACFAGLLTSFVKYREQFQAPMINGHVYGFNSKHPGGVHITLCDGSARFFTDDMDNTTVEFMVRIDDGQVL